MEFIIKGKISGGISKTEVKSILHACDVIMQFHGKNVIDKSKSIRVLFVDDSLGSTKTGTESAACAYHKKMLIKVRYEDQCEYSELMTLLIHEMIHLYIRFNDDEKEKLTSTLTGKLKNDISQIANIICGGTFRRAAYIAHTKISYMPVGDDHYDSSQYHCDHESSVGVKYRRKKCDPVIANKKDEKWD